MLPTAACFVSPEIASATTAQPVSTILLDIYTETGEEIQRSNVFDLACVFVELLEACHAGLVFIPE